MDRRASFIRRTTRSAWACGVVALGVLGGLVVAEAIVRVFSPDFRYVDKIVPRQTVILSSLEADPDPRVRYRLRPGVTRYWFGTVTINSLGFRGPERPARKPPGVTRILVVGGSNPFGFAVDDGQTWPAQLEERLNAKHRGRVEVWNRATCGYDTGPDLVAARQALADVDFDAVILALSNMRNTWFLSGQDVRPYLERDPNLWTGAVAPSFLAFPRWLSRDARLTLLRRVGVYRMALLGATAIGARLGKWYSWFGFPDEDSDQVRRFVAETRERARVGIFVCPWCMINAEYYRRLYRGLDVPILELPADGMPRYYLEMHPRPPVLAWYADQIARWVDREGLLEPLARRSGASTKTVAEDR